MAAFTALPGCPQLIEPRLADDEQASPLAIRAAAAIPAAILISHEIRIKASFYTHRQVLEQQRVNVDFLPRDVLDVNAAVTSGRYPLWGLTQITDAAFAEYATIRA